MVQVIYALLSIVVMVLVVAFGVGSRSNYVPQREVEELGHSRRKEEADDSTA